MTESGLKIGIIALSAPCRPGMIEEVSGYLRRLGHQVTIALDPAAQYGSKLHLFSSDSAAARAEAFQALVRDPEIDLVLSARGAYGTMEVLPLLDYAALREHPKPVVGFSDTTAALLALQGRCGFPTIHGPSASSLSESVESGAGRADFDRVLALLNGERFPFGNLRLERHGPGGEIEGELIGGNLTMLAALMGTPWQPELEGKILFFEDIGVKPYALHRLLLQMKLSGIFEGLRGVLVGRLSGCEHARGMGPSARECVLEVFGGLQIPVFFNAPFGHAGPNNPLPLGRRAVLRTENILELR